MELQINHVGIKRSQPVITSLHFYRPQQSWAKVIFLQASVILSMGGSLAGRPPLWQGEPPSKETPRQGEPPWQGEPPARRPPWQGEPPQQGEPPWQGDPPRQGEPPPPGRETPLPAIRSMSGRYASYWNAFLYLNVFQLTTSVVTKIFTSVANLSSGPIITLF